MDRFTQDQVILNIKNLYWSPHPEVRTACDSFLKSFQRSLQSWEICTEVLKSEQFDEQIWLFCSISLKKKLLFDFEELEKENMFEFKNLLLQICWKFGHCFKVLRQLALCVGLLAVHLAFEWGDLVLPDLEKVFSNNFPGLLVMVEGLAFELQDKETVVDHAKVVFLKEKLRPHFSQVFDLILTPGLDLVLAVQVFTAWVQLDFCHSIPKIEESQLFASVFQMVFSQEANDQGFLALNQIINLSAGQSDLKLSEALQQNLEKIWPQVMENKDFWTFEYFVRVYCNFTGIHLKNFLINGNFKFFSLILELFKEKNKETTEEITKFWHRTLKFVVRNREKIEKIQKFEEIVEGLLRICLNLFKITKNELCGSLQLETEEIRGDLSILLENIADFLTPSKVSGLILNEVKLLLSLPLIQVETLIEIEALVSSFPSFLLLSGETFFNSNFNQVLEKLTFSLSSFPQFNISVITMIASVPYELSPQVLTQSLNLLFSCLEQGQACENLSKSFKKIIQNNSATLMQDSQLVKQIYSVSYSLPEHPADLILEATSLVFWQSSNKNQDIFLLINDFSKFLSNDDEQLLIHATQKLGIIFKSASLVKTVDVPTIGKAFQGLWPELQVLFGFLNKELIESVCRIINNVIKRLGQAFEVFLPDLIRAINSFYPLSLSSAFLYTAETLIKYMSQREALENHFLELFQSISAATIAAFQRDASLILCPEIVEDFYGMCCKFLHVFSVDLMNLDVFLNILDYSTLTIGISEIQAGKCLYKFIQLTFELTVDSSESCQTDFQTHSIISKFSSILNLLIKALVQVVPSGLFDVIQELLSQLLSSSSGYTWLKLSLDSIPHDCLTQGEKSSFLSNVLNGLEVNSWIRKLYKRSKRRALREF